MTVVKPKVGDRELRNVEFVVGDDNTKHCMSYGSEVAMIDRDGKYIEFNGTNFYSKTSVRHKNVFKKYYNVKEK